MSIRVAIFEQMAEVASQQGQHLATLRDDRPLLETGLDSLSIAILVANLEDQTGLDPFACDDVAFPVTVGDFVRLYEHAKH